METISIIIPNFNGLQLLKKNLPEVVKLKLKYQEIVEIIIVDDCSTDRSIEYIKNAFPAIKTIKKTTNTGFSDSVNIGVRDSRGSLVLLLNTDVKPDINMLESLLKYFRNSKTFAVGCLDNSIEKGKVIKRGRGIGVFEKGFLIHKRGEIDKNNTLWVSGGSSLFRKSIWEKLGGLDPLFSPFYWEDIDISYRALKSGYEIYFEKNAQVAHDHELGSIKSYFNKQQIEQIALRNQILFVWKNISDTEYLFSHLISLLKNILNTLFRGNTAFLKAFIQAFIKTPIVISHRLNQSRHWVKKDREIFEAFRREF